MPLRMLVISFMICEWIILECLGNVKLLFFTIHKIFRIRAPLLQNHSPIPGLNHSLHLDITNLCQPSVPLQSELIAIFSTYICHRLKSALLERQKLIFNLSHWDQQFLPFEATLYLFWTSWPFSTFHWISYSPCSFETLFGQIQLQTLVGIKQPHILQRIT